MLFGCLRCVTVNCLIAVQPAALQVSHTDHLTTIEKLALGVRSDNIHRAVV
jgi:hypothetical protein